MKRQARQILIGGGVYALALCLSAGTVKLALFVAAYLICGGDVLWRSAKNLRKGEWLDENFLMSLATVGAFVIGEYPEAVAVMLFYQTGEFFLHWALHRSRRSVRALLELQPDTVLVRREGGWRHVPAQSVEPGEVFRVKPGERTALESSFCVFKETKWGIRALCRLLLTYYRRDGLETVEEIIRRYAPAKENDTESYIKDVCQRTGFKAQEKLRLTDRETMLKLIKAIIWHENGLQPYEDKELSVGMRLAGIG